MTVLHKQKDASLVTVARKIIHCVDTLSRKSFDTATNVFSDLGRVASAVLCKLAFSVIFQVSCSSEKRKQYEEIAEECFTDFNYDVMLHSVKAFKKGLYSAITTLSHDANCTFLQKREIFSSIAKLAIRSLLKILKRDGSMSHPPTLRRLSRIALEVLRELKSIGAVDGTDLNGMASLSLKSDSDVFVTDANFCDNVILYSDQTVSINRGSSKSMITSKDRAWFSITEFTDLSSQQFWDMSVMLVRIGGYNPADMNMKPVEVSGGTGLAGNALELMAFAILEQLNSVSTESSLFSKQINIFVNLIGQLTHPLTSWKVRYSAVAAINNSELIRMSSKAHNIPQPLIDASISKLYLKLLELLEDGDEDVRRESERALSTSRQATISLMTLQDVSFNLSAHFQTKEMYNLLLNNLADRCRPIEHQMTNLLTEYQFTTNNPTELENILNLNAERKIFEEEDPNSYEESLVIMQSLIVMITKFPFEFSRNNDKTMSTFSELCLSYERVLNQIVDTFNQTKRCPDVAHNVTMDGNAYSVLHGLILSVAIGRLFGVEGQRAVSLTEDILGMDTVYVHPCITLALKLMTQVKRFDAESKNRIIQSCFLLQHPTHPK